MEQKQIWGIICRLIIPRFRITWLPTILLIALLGSLIAGVYGILHDQLTYTISAEYYTKVKFYQFHYLPENVPNRVRVGMIGFLATAGMGGIFGWFLGRIAVPRHSCRNAIRVCLNAFGLLFLITLSAGILGYAMGGLAARDTGKWEQVGYLFGIQELAPFVRVAVIHQAGYIGGFIGLVVCCIRLYRTPGTQVNDPDHSLLSSDPATCD